MVMSIEVVLVVLEVNCGMFIVCECALVYFMLAFGF